MQDQSGGKHIEPAPFIIGRVERDVRIATLVGEKVLLRKAAVGAILDVSTGRLYAPAQRYADNRSFAAVGVVNPAGEGDLVEQNLCALRRLLIPVLAGAIITRIAGAHDQGCLQSF